MDGDLYSFNRLSVLSWNIMGKSRSGLAHARNVLVPKIVGDVNPDVVLLQEIGSTKIVNYIASTCSFMWGRLYKYVSTDKQNGTYVKAAGVLYDSHKFMVVPQQEQKDRMNLDPFIPQEQANDAVKKDYEERVVAIQLEHKDTKKQIILIMSFHNKNDESSAQLSKMFCQIVSKIAGSKQEMVVAGADLNWKPDKEDSSVKKTFIPDYEATDRRLSLDEIDHFILAQHQVNAVKALNIIPPTSPHCEMAYKRKEYHDALNHDPLVCELSIVSNATWSIIV